MRGLLLKATLLLVLVAALFGSGRLSNPFGDTVAHAQSLSCASMLMEEDGGYVPELGIYWSARTYLVACEDSLGNVTFGYATVLAIWDGNGNAAVYMRTV